MLPGAQARETVEGERVFFFFFFVVVKRLITILFSKATLSLSLWSPLGLCLFSLFPPLAIEGDNSGLLKARVGCRCGRRQQQQRQRGTRKTR